MNIEQTDFQLTLLTIRYLSQIGEAIACGLEETNSDEMPNGMSARKTIKVMQMCFDRVEHIAQYALETHDDNTWKISCMVGDVEWLKFVISDHQPLLQQGVAKHCSKPTAEMLNQLLNDLVGRLQLVRKG
jgi:hypothetical protein